VPPPGVLAPRLLIVSPPPPPSLGPARERALRHRLNLSIRDACLTDLALTEFWSPDSPFWELDATPLILTAAEWRPLESALRQRARLINTLLVDLYDRREALRADILPPELVLDDPYYRRPRQGLSPARENPATLIRFDLIRTAGGWVFTDIHANTPVGVSYAVQNRRFLTQEAGDYYRDLPDYHSIVNFPLHLLDALRALSPRADRSPQVVVLTTGPNFPFFSEHSFLARKMGLPLVRGDDLIVIDNHVYFKTVAGLERVDVIYRRLNDAHIDPVVFPTERESAGIPGLLQCIRAGHVVLANDLGSGLAESRALHPFLGRLARFYLGEPLQLPQIPTLSCGDIDQLGHYLDHRDDYRLLPAHDPRLGQSPLNLRPGVRGLPRAVQAQPHAFVARRRLTAQALSAGRRAPPFRLSAYVLAQGRNYTVLPGGVVNLGEDPPAQRVGPTADFIVLTDDTDRVGDISDLETTVAVGAQATLPGSHAAECLCWLGRYLERAENSARMLAILDDVAMEEIPPADRARWLPIWRGLLEALGQSDVSPARRAPRAAQTRDLSRRLALDPAEPGSLPHSIQAALRNAAVLRDYVSPEAWSCLSRVADRLADLAGVAPRNPTPRIEQAVATVLAGVNAFLATAERTMLHDASWQFLIIGVHLERAALTGGALRPVLGSLDALARTPSSTPAEDLIYRDNPELSALLRMLGCQDAYRRLYQTRSQPRFVAEVFLQQAHVPRSLPFAFDRLLRALEVLRDETRRKDADPVHALLTRTRARLRDLPLSRYFTAPPHAPETPLADVLDELLETINELHPLLSDRYFSHQATLGEGTRVG
jgi:uncharacterized circularly permuted ATP-grasp superfamily protein/uncharacterized alpha-E superfamily protein